MANPLNGSLRDTPTERQNKKRVLVTGGAGFIGSHFCDRALAQGHEVVAFDDLSTGREIFLAAAFKNPAFRLVRGDIRNFDEIQKACGDFKPDLIAHFAANADVRHGLERPRRDLDYNTIGTWNVVESARLSGCKNLIFSSTGSVYGEPAVFPTPEECPFPVQTSLYAASKLAGEGILSAYAIGYQMNVTVFRFVSILGPRYTHGHIFDFVKSLRKDSTKLRVLGNGLQLKSYLHVDDLMDGLWLVINNDHKNAHNNDQGTNRGTNHGADHAGASGGTRGMNGYQVLNIGHDDALTVNRSISYIVDELKLKPELNYSGGERGWVGDSPRIQLATEKLKATGWSAKRTLEQAVRETVNYLQEHSLLFEETK